MTSKINNTHLPKSNLPADLSKAQKPSSSLVRDTLQSSQKESKYSSCNWFVEGIKRLFEKFLSFLRCIFCCKCPKKETTNDQTIASTTNATKPDQSKKQETKASTLAPVKPESKSTTAEKTVTIPRPDQDNKTEEKTTVTVTKPSETKPHSEEALSAFEKMPLVIQSLCAEYLDEEDKIKLVLASRDLSRTTYDKLLKDQENRETISSEDLQTLLEKVKALSNAFSDPVDFNKACEIVFAHCQHLKEFIFSGPFDYALMKNVAIHLPSSVRVSFLNTKIRDVDLKVFVECCPQLRGIDLRGCPITDVGLKTLETNCKQLQDLKLSFPDDFTFKGLFSLLANCKELKNLSLFSIHSAMDDQVLHELAKKCPQLQRLVLGSCHSITDAGLQFLAANCKHLQYLNLQSNNTTDAGLQALANQCKELLDLEFSYSPKITSLGVLSIATNCKKLQRLTLPYLQITDEELQLLSANCKQLQEIGLNSITNAVLQAFAENCQQLQCITLTDSTISDDGMLALIAKCKKLKKVKLHLCPWITDETLRALSANCDQLQELDLSLCTKITDAGLGAIATNCKKLQVLNLGMCNNITDAGLQTLAANLGQLRKLSLGHRLINDAGLLALVLKCKLLEQINLSYCHNITNAAIQELKKHCPNLRMIFNNEL